MRTYIRPTTSSCYILLGKKHKLCWLRVVFSRTGIIPLRLYINKMKKPSHCGATCIASVSLSSKTMFYTHNFDEKKIIKKSKTKEL